MVKRVTLALMALLLLTLVGCSKAPEAEMNAAKAALDAARAAEAEQYVPDAFRQAADALAQADAAKTEQDGKFALFRSYGKSKEMYVNAQGMADKVVADAAAEKERVKQEVVGLMVEAKAAVDSAMAALAKAPRGKDTKAELELIKTQLDGLTPALAEAQADFDAGRYLVARQKVNAIKESAMGIVNEIAMAAARKKG